MCGGRKKKKAKPKLLKKSTPKTETSSETCNAINSDDYKESTGLLPKNSEIVSKVLNISKIDEKMASKFLVKPSDTSTTDLKNEGSQLSIRSEIDAKPVPINEDKRKTKIDSKMSLIGASTPETGSRTGSSIKSSVENKRNVSKSEENKDKKLEEEMSGKPSAH